MKKLVGISLIAMLSVSPIMAFAEAVSTGTGDAYTPASYVPANAQDTGASVTATTTPKFDLAQSAESDVNAASAGYVKGAYNAAIKAVNKVHEEAAAAQETATAISNAAIKGVQVNGTALTKDTNGVVNVKVEESANNGKIKVNGTDVAVHGLGSAAYTASTAYATSSQGTKADNAVQGVKVNGTALAEDSNHDVNITIASGTANGTIKVNGTDVAVTGVLTQHQSLTDYAKKTGVEATIKNTTLTQGSVTQGLTGSVSGTTSTVAKIMTVWGDDETHTNVNALTAVSNGNLATNVKVAAPSINKSSVVYSETVN